MNIALKLERRNPQKQGEGKDGEEKKCEISPKAMHTCNIKDGLGAV
jgi:hypothetical protein